MMREAIKQELLNIIREILRQHMAAIEYAIKIGDPIHSVEMNEDDGAIKAIFDMFESQIAFTQAMNEEFEKQLRELVDHFGSKERRLGETCFPESCGALADAESAKEDIIRFVMTAGIPNPHEYTPHTTGVHEQKIRPGTKLISAGKVGGAVYFCDAVVRIEGKVGYILNGRFFPGAFVENKEYFTALEVIEEVKEWSTRSNES